MARRWKPLSAASARPMLQAPPHASMLAALLLLLLLPEPTCVSGRVLPSVHRLVEQAKPFANDLSRHGGVPIKDRLAVMIMNSQASNVEVLNTKESTMYKSITLLLKHIVPTTPLDIYIWLRAGAAPPDPGNHAFNSLGSNIAVMPLLSEHWQRHHMDNFMADEGLDFGDYRMMGQWRLEVQFTFGALIGYEYVLQYDDDSYVLGPYPYNIIEQLRSRDALMAGRRVFTDHPFFFAGLPELARAFIVMHSGEYGHVYKHLPPERQFQPPTRLYNHCNPRNISGLHTMLTNTPWGFDNSYVHGNSLIMKTELWMRPLVQDFVQLCLLSGGVYRHRWIDQSVEAFVWHMFVPDTEGKDQFMLLEQLPFRHGKPFLTMDEWQAAMNGTAQAPVH